MSEVWLIQLSYLLLFAGNHLHTLKLLATPVTFSSGTQQKCLFHIEEKLQAVKYTGKFA